MNQPWIYLCSTSRSPLLPPSLSDPSGSSQCTSPEHLSHASNLDWWSVSPLIVYLFQCYSLRTSHPRLLPQSLNRTDFGTVSNFNEGRKFLIFHSFFTSVCVHTWSLSHVRPFATPWTIAFETPLSMEFFRQAYWSRLPFPPLGDLPNPEIKPTSPPSPSLAGSFFYHWAIWEAYFTSVL